MGQYSALVAAGALSLDDGIRLVRERGRLMQASGGGRDGAMAALIGLDDARLPELVAGRLAPTASSSSPTATPRARSSSRGSGPPSRPAPRSPRTSAPSAPSCCPSRSRPTPRSWPRRPTGCAPPSPTSPSATRTRRCSPTPTPDRSRPPTRCRAELVEHLTAGVDWVGAVEPMTDAGVTTFVEVGPGKVLTGLIRRIAPDAEIVAADDPASIDRLLELAAPA